MTVTWRRSALVFLAAGVTTLTGCDTLLGPRDNSVLRDQLARGEAKWAEAAASNYDVVVTRGPLYAEGHPTVALEVRDGVIVGGTYPDTGEPVEPFILDGHQTVPELFDLIRDALGRRVPAIAVSYDQELGFPREIIIDYDSFRIDDDLYVAVSDFAAVDP